MLRLYLPRSARVPAGSPFLVNLLERYFDSSEVEVVRDRDDKSRLTVVPCNSAYRLSRKLAAFKGKNIFAYDSLSDVDRSALQKRNTRLVVDMGGEMFFTRPEMIEGMHEGLVESGLERSQIVIVNGDATAEENYLEYCRRSNVVDPVPILTMEANPFFFLAHQRMKPDAFLRHVESAEEQRAKIGRKKLFLNFNGRSRDHRIYLVLLLMAHGLMDYGHVSLLHYTSSAAGTAVGPGDPDQLHSMAMQLRSLYKNWPLAEFCLPHVEALLAKLPLELDLPAKDSISNSRYDQVTPWEMQNLDLYHGSYLSLVTDTLLPKDNLLFVTEKVYKSFVGFHPFIYIGCARALEHLRAMGFQTFHPLVNEDYDLEPHGLTRLIKALDELRRLASLPEARLREIYAELWPRLLHNARHACVDSASWVKTRLDQEVRQRLQKLGTSL